ncbi:hypothetical protein [Bacillus mycoides]
MLEFLRLEDTVVVIDLTRLLCSTKDLIKIKMFKLKKNTFYKIMKKNHEIK